MESSDMSTAPGLESELEDELYLYDTLEEQPIDAIRILTVQPRDAELISCNLSTVRLSAEPVYSALSYVWGREERVKTILIDGKRFTVRPNLWAFLRRLQRGDRLVRIWVDAICINQDDIPERNAQVPLMSKIYTQADSVYSWFGSAIESGLDKWHELEQLMQLPLPKLRAKFIVDKPAQEVARVTYNTISRISGSRYWERTWIIQELLFGQNIRLWYGDVGELSFADFDKIFSFMVEHHLDFRFCMQPYLYTGDGTVRNGPLLAGLLKMKREKLEKISLLRLVQYGFMTRCMDSRDKIYAFVNFANDRDRCNVAVDYGKSPADLYLDFITSPGDRGSPILENRSYYAEALRKQLGCTSLELLASTRLTREIAAGSYFDLLVDPSLAEQVRAASRTVDPTAALRAKLGWILQQHQLELYQAELVVCLGPVLDPTAEDHQTQACSLLCFIIALVKLRRQPSKSEDDWIITSLLNNEDISVTFVQEPPVDLYYLGSAINLRPTDRGAEVSTAISAPKGITRYTLDECIALTELEQYSKEGRFIHE